uniref:Uncharacterized protein n=1 Tax=Sphaerodactylus townsendi TaxID=933632 RepID=A0ACB8EI41_9SAUR
MALWQQLGAGARVGTGLWHVLLAGTILTSHIQPNVVGMAVSGRVRGYEVLMPNLTGLNLPWTLQGEEWRKAQGLGCGCVWLSYAKCRNTNVRRGAASL